MFGEPQEPGQTGVSSQEIPRPAFPFSEPFCPHFFDFSSLAPEPRSEFEFISRRLAVPSPFPPFSHVRSDQALIGPALCLPLVSLVFQLPKGQRRARQLLPSASEL